MQLAKKQLREIYSHNNIRQSEALQSERLDRGRLGRLGLEFRLLNDVMEFMLPFVDYAHHHTTSWDNCQIMSGQKVHFTWGRNSTRLTLSTLRYVLRANQDASTTLSKGVTLELTNGSICATIYSVNPNH